MPKKIALYSLIGLFTNLSSLAIYYYLVESFGFRYQISWMFSYFFALTCSFILNNFITFNLKDFPLKRLIRFFLSNAILGMASFIFLVSLIELVEINYFLSQVLVILLFYPLSFLFFSRKVFIKN